MGAPSHRAVGREGLPTATKLRRRAHRQRAQRHRIDEREDGRVRADPEGQREDGGCGKARTPPHRSKRISHVTQCRLDERHASRLSAQLLDLLDPAQRETRLTDCLGAWQAHSHLFLDCVFDVQPQSSSSSRSTVSRRRRALESGTTGRSESNSAPSSTVSPDASTAELSLSAVEVQGKRGGLLRYPAPLTDAPNPSTPVNQKPPVLQIVTL